MRLKNSKNIERDFNLLFKFSKGDKTYVVYQDTMSNKIYGGKLKDKKLKILNASELEMLNSILERING